MQVSEDRELPGGHFLSMSGGGGVASSSAAASTNTSAAAALGRRHSAERQRELVT
jgi:hypothetical protein